MSRSQQLIQALGLTRHGEGDGGFFRQTFFSTSEDKVTTPRGDRKVLSAIYFMATKDHPKGYWHQNMSDVMHFYHVGSPTLFHMIDPSTGSYSTTTLGPEVTNGHVLQFVAKGGTLKALEMVGGEFSLFSEAVAPAFDPQDFRFLKREELLRQFPQHKELVLRLTQE